MKLAWMTDLHLEFLGWNDVEKFIKQTGDVECDAFIICGDIGQAHSTGHFLKEMAIQWRRPIYFVLGNHDYYKGSIKNIREHIGRICAHESHLIYLSEQNVPMPIGDKTWIIGHDGWADTRAGRYETSPIELNDFVLIGELMEQYRPKEEIRKTMQELAAESVEHVRCGIRAIGDGQHVIIVMHVPPTRESSCNPAGNLSDDAWAPFFVNQVMGDMLIEEMQRRPEVQATVLCGHTHNSADVKPLPNLRIVAGGAAYGHPKVQDVIEAI
jgi:predicted phosphodiesterase